MSFDRDAALGRAAEVFWRTGYEAAGISTLTAAMAISPQSLYTAFGSKEQLYREALDWYRRHVGAFTAEALAAPGPIAEVVRAVLRGSAREFTRKGQPRGCMISTAALGCADEHGAVAAHAAQMRQEALDALAARLRQAKADGSLRPDADIEALARLFGAAIQGMAIQARDGASKADLVGLADVTAAAFSHWSV